jgi:hypothetical protein
MDAHRLLLRRLKKFWNRLSIPFWRFLLFHDFQSQDPRFYSLNVHGVVDILISAGMTVEKWDTYWKSKESFFLEIVSYSHQTRSKVWQLWTVMQQEKQVHLFHPSVKIGSIMCSSSVIDYDTQGVTLVDSQTGEVTQEWIRYHSKYGFYMNNVFGPLAFIYVLVLSRWLWKQERLLEYSTFLQCFTNPIPGTPLYSFRNHKLCDDCVITHILKSFLLGIKGKDAS